MGREDSFVVGRVNRFLIELEKGTPPNLGSLSSPRGGRCPIVADGIKGVEYIEDNGQNKLLIRAVVDIFDLSPLGPDNQY